MKKRLNFLFYFFSTLLFSQDYVPLLDDYNEWQVTNCYFGCLTDVYYTDGDTIADGHNYKILDGYHFISRTILLREDILEKKVFLNFIQATGNTEYLLYDFSLNIDDSIDMKNPISPFLENAGYYNLDSIIPRPLVNGNDYRHFYLSPSESNIVSTTNAIWIEGAGSLSLITAPSGEPDINGAGHLSCFYKNGDYFYTNLDSIDSCEPTVILNINESNYPLSDIIVSSNNILNSCHLINLENIKLIDIYNINGKRVASYHNNGNKELKFDTTSYQAGIYFIIVYTNQFKKKTIKIIIE
jgi:hypothetical protein